jgi:hypothetical protein
MEVKMSSAHAGVADQLAQLVSQQSISPNRSYSASPEANEIFDNAWHLPLQLPVFSGRQAELTRLADSFAKQQQPCVIRHTKKISGTGGIGKTQLAVEFAHRMIKARQFDKVIWLNADTSVTNQLDNEVLALAQAMKLMNIQGDSALTLQAIYNALSQRGTSLVILDNAVNYQALQAYLPIEKSGISVLITTRDANTWTSDFDQVILDIFNLEEACEYLAKALKDKYEPIDANDLAILLGRFPLALAQAAGYIVSRNISIRDYLNLYHQQKKIQQKLLDTQGFQAEPHKQTIWITVNLCLEQLKYSISTDLLVRCALLSAQSPIDKELLACANLSAEVSIESVLIELQNYSLIDPTIDHGFVQIHQLVQDIVMLAVMPKGIDVDEQLVNLLEECRDYLLKIYKQGKFFFKRHKLLPHSEKICSTSEPVADAQHKKMNSINTSIILLKTEESAALFQLGNYESSRRSATKALERKKFLTEKVKLVDALIPHTSVRLAYALSAMGKASACVTTIKHAIEEHQQYPQLNEEERDLASTVLFTCLAYIHFDQGNYQKSYVIMIEVMKLHKKLKLLGQDAYNSSRFLYAILCSVLGHFDQAEEHFTASYDYMLEHHDANSLSLAAKKIDLSAHYARTERLEEAKILMDEAYPILVDNLTENHTEVASLLSNLASYYLAKDNIQAYHDTAEKAYRIRLCVSGANHPDTNMNLAAYALAKHYLNDTSQAILLLEDAFSKISCVYSDNNYFVGEISKILGECYISQVNSEQAEPYLLRALSSVHFNFSNNFEKIQNILSQLLNVFLIQKKFRHANKYYRLLDELFHKHKLESSTGYAKLMGNAYFIEIFGYCDLVRARRALVTAKKMYSNSGLEKDLENFEYIATLFSKLDELSVMPFSVLVNSVAENKNDSYELSFDPFILTELADDGPINSLLKIQIFLDHLLSLECYDAVDIVSAKILQQGLFTEEILPYYVKASMELRFLNSASKNLQSCLQNTPSAELLKIKERLNILLREEVELIKQFNIGTIKLEKGQLSNREILLHAKCAFELGKYPNVVEMLGKFEHMFENDNTLLAVLEFHRAKSYCMQGAFSTAKLAIEKSLALNENATARLWYKKIVIGFEVDELSKLIFKRFDWQALRIENQISKSGLNVVLKPFK